MRTEFEQSAEGMWRRKKFMFKISNVIHRLAHEFNGCILLTNEVSDVVFPQTTRAGGNYTVIVSSSLKKFVQRWGLAGLNILTIVSSSLKKLTLTETSCLGACWYNYHPIYLLRSVHSILLSRVLCQRNW